MQSEGLTLALPPCLFTAKILLCSLYSAFILESICAMIS